MDALADTATLSEPLAGAARNFLTAYGSPALLGDEWAKVFIGIHPEDRLDALLTACGFDGDPDGFFHSIRQGILEALAQGKSADIAFNGFRLPKMFLYHILDTLLPGQRLGAMKTTRALAAATGFPVTSQRYSPAALQAVLDTYPVRLSRHVIRQAMVSEAVAAQYLPFADELDPNGHELTFDGHFKQGLMEQMYRNRAIFLLDMRCPVYCRFCFRKHKSLRKEASPTPEDVAVAVEKVGQNPEVREILITGGEPLLNRNNLEAAITGLAGIDHVRTLRIATRSLAYYPHLFLHHDRSVINYLMEKQVFCRDRGKQIEVGVHLVHPDEISVQTLEIISKLTAGGIPVYVQTPFLKGLNDTGEVLARLFTALRQAGAEIYYIFTPCHPIHGTQKYWSPISDSIAAYNYLRSRVSDRCIPKLCTATPLGKMEWHTSGWAVEKDREDPDHIWIRTPYTRSYFEGVTGELSLPHAVRENRDGSLNVKCLIDMGDERLFLKNFGLEKDRGTYGDNEPLNEERLVRITARILESNPLMPAEEVCPGVRQLHATRIETGPELTAEALMFLSAHPEITDIVVHLPDAGDLNLQISQIRDLVRQLDGFDHRAFAVRIRWQAFMARPQDFDGELIANIRGAADVSLTRPRLLEVETWWMAPGQVLPAHRKAARALTAAGIRVYGNLPLISGVNDTPEMVADTAHALRHAGIEFHHVYAAGLSLQNERNTACPIPADRVLAIASHVRKVCSGREIPLYVIWTPKGEKDFGLGTSGPVAGLSKIPGFTC
ncbi:MAG TPA: lysine 2,3-aminomutase [Desulfobacteraceae bacterium]|mgnify:CR=1 FL=1|nr:lysine 2,3-aminomutase [Desulfobacteraceae bacterium]